MSQDRNYLRTDSNPVARLREEGLMLHMKGAGYACAFCTVALVIILAFMWVGNNLLPEESRETEDPTPFSNYLIVEDTKQA